MTQTNDTKPNPWSACADSVIFILDAANSLERQLLEEWLAQHRPAPGGVESAEQVVIAIAGSSDKGDDIDTGSLGKLLDTPDDTLVVPLRIAWSPAAELIDSGPRLRDLIFSEPGPPRTWLERWTLRRDSAQASYIAGQPGTVAELGERFSRRLSADRRQQPEAFATFVARQAGLALDMAERQQLPGGRYKVPRFIPQTISANPDYIEGVQELAAERNQPLAEVWQKARGYMKEMISFPSRFYIDFYASFNSYVLGLGYENKLIYDPKDIERMRTWVRQHPSMILWTHKTYLDGMVAPKVLYDNDFPLPHMFAGGNMGFAGLGFLLRRAGGIFVRRSFQDNPLYKLTLRHYIGYLMEKRFPMHWAFEGTRSRLGKLMPPRFGLLKYVLEACRATDAEKIHIIPVSISFDLIPDVEEYATEQAGRAKSAETLRWFIGYVRSLKKPMGRVYMDIGEPIVLDKAPDPDDRLALSKIAFQVAVEANRVTPLTLASLLTMSLLGAAPRALTTKELIVEGQALLSWARARDIRISSDFDIANAEHMRELLGILIGEGVLTRYEEGSDKVYGVAPEQHPVASYYRNTIIHFFVNKAIIELAVVKAGESGESEDPVALFWSSVDRLRALFKFEFFYAPTQTFHQQIRQEMECSCPDWETQLQQGGSAFNGILVQLQPLVAHTALLIYVEAYTVVAELLAKRPADAGLDQKTCIEEALKYGRQAYLQRRISSEASIGKMLFQNGYKLLANLGLTDAGGEEVAQARRDMVKELQALSAAMDRTKALAAAWRSAQVERMY